MSDKETPPVDDFVDVDHSSDYMLHEDDDFKEEPSKVNDEVLQTDDHQEIDLKEDSLDDDEDIFGSAKDEDKSDLTFAKMKDGMTVKSEPIIAQDVSAMMEELQVEDPITDEVVDDTKVKIEVEPEEVYDIVIQVSDPHKIGEGVMNSYMAYKVKTKTSLSQFRNSEITVDRRFSDFLGLHEKLLAKHRHVGHIVPPAPEKSVIGMTLVKISKNDEEAVSIDFVEKRRAALERYLNRLTRHAPVVHDQNLIDFLELPTLPQATSTRALSGAGVMRFVKNVEGAFNKITVKMVEEDPWFEEKQQQIDNLEVQLKKLHSAFESLVQHRKELAINTAVFAKSAASLGNAEEHTSLSRALAQLSDSFEKLEGQHQEQANKDFYYAAETLSDYLRIIEEIKEVFMVRVKSWQNWKQAEQAVQRKREAEMKMQASGRTDKLYQIKAEIDELGERVEVTKKDFEKLSASIKKEIGLFEKDRIADFQKLILIFLKSMMKSQEQCLKNWEAFLPEARAIA